MKILLISYDHWKYDGRLRELVKVAKELGEVTYITRRSDGEEPQEENHILYTDHGYPAFIRFCCLQARRLGKADLIFIDNRKGILPGYLAKRICGARYVVQDCRELYDMKSAAGIPGKIGCVMEKIFTRHSDVVIAANPFRAKIMVKMFGLKKTPLNYENIRRLEYTEAGKQRQMEEENGDFFREKRFRIISTAGCDMSRTTGKLLEAMKELGGEYELLLVGENDEEDEILAGATIRELGLTNVKILPRMDQDHLKYFIENCQIGFVAYHQRDLNNKYCASGKIFEFLYEGKPVLASTNPPLKELCEKYGIGIASDDYVSAVRKLAGDYSRWTEQVDRFISRVHVEKNNHKLAEQIRKELKEG